MPYYISGVFCLHSFTDADKRLTGSCLWVNVFRRETFASMPEPTTSLHAGLDCPTSQRLMLHHLPVWVKAVKAKNVNQSVAYARERESDIVRTSSEVVFPTSEKNETTSEINFTPSEENKCFQTIL